MVKRLLQISALALCYILLARAGLYLATLNDNVSPVWPATGFAFSILYIFGWRASYAIFIGAFVTNTLIDTPIFTSLAIATGNTLEAIIGVTIIVRTLQYKKNLSFQTETIAICLASALGSFASATIGVSTLYLTGTLPLALVTQVWTTWWVGDTLGGLVVTPLLIRFRDYSFPKENWLHIIGVALTGCFAFYIVFIAQQGNPFLFVLFPVLLYATKSIGEIGVLILSLLICVGGVVATVTGYGPFTLGDLNERLVHIQLFLASIAITSLMLASFGKTHLTKLSTGVLLAAWFASGALFFSFELSEKSKTEQLFQSQVTAAQTEISETLTKYEQVMRSGSGLYAASRSVELGEWQRFVAALDVQKNFPSVTGLGVIVPVTSRDIPKLEKSIHQEGIVEYKVKPARGTTFAKDAKAEHLIVKYIEPLGLNSESIGVDISTEETRRNAAYQARDSGHATITSVIQVSQGSKTVPGFLFFLPFYKTGAIIDTPEQKQKALSGWIFGRFIIEKFCSNIAKLSNHELTLQTYDGETIDPSKLVYSNLNAEKDGARKFETVTHIQMGNRKVTMVWGNGSAFVSSHNTIVAWVSFCGALSSLLLTNLMLSLQLVGKRSRELADELTQELSTSREKFREGERRLLYALDGSNDGIWDWNIATSEMYVSGGICVEYGWPQKFKCATVKDMKKVVHPDDLDAITASINKHLARETDSHEVETRYLTKKGDYKWVLSRGKISEYDIQGRPTRMTGVHIDIHELKMAQEALVNTQYQLRNIANTVPTLISLWDKNLSCEFTNDSFAQWFGMTQAELLGCQLKELIGDEAFANRVNVFHQAMNGIQQSYEREVVRQIDGETRYIAATLLPNRMNGQHDGFFLFIQDITDLKQAEIKATREHKIAVDATNVKSQFLANMSHEIRTPLNGIIGIANLMKSTVLSPKQAEYAEIIERSSLSLLAIINDILDFSKMEAGKLSLETIDFDIETVLSDIHKSFLFSAKQKHINLIFDTDNGANRFYRGDPTRLTQILNNLIGNAIKFTQVGSVTVRSRIEQTEGSISHFHFEVIDTGIGIPSEALGKMFLAFTQADTTTSRKFGGTGLGLSITKQLVELMAGEIGVHSQIGYGSTLWFKIPLAEGVAPEAEIPAVTKNTLAGARILLAEDNEVNQLIAVETLTGLGFKIDIAKNGLEAVKALQYSTYDLILMDCQMPEMDGYQATGEIRASLEKYRSIPIIAMTANAFKGDREKCLDAGMNDYIAKPFKKAALLEVIHKWIKKGPLNEVALQQIRLMQPAGGPDLFARLVKIYFESAEADMTRIRTASVQKNWKALAEAAHSLKSSSANLGAHLLSELCAQLEKFGDNATNNANASQLLLQLETEYVEAIAALRNVKPAA